MDKLRIPQPLDEEAPTRSSWSKLIFHRACMQVMTARTTSRHLKPMVIGISDAASTLTFGSVEVPSGRDADLGRLQVGAASILYA